MIRCGENALNAANVAFARIAQAMVYPSEFLIEIRVFAYKTAIISAA
jgi:hypothetical protein